MASCNFNPPEEKCSYPPEEKSETHVWYDEFGYAHSKSTPELPRGPVDPSNNDSDSQNLTWPLMPGIAELVSVVDPADERRPSPKINQVHVATSTPAHDMQKLNLPSPGSQSPIIRQRSMRRQLFEDRHPTLPIDPNAVPTFIDSPGAASFQRGGGNGSSEQRSHISMDSAPGAIEYYSGNMADLDSQNRTWAQSYDSLYAKRFSHDPVMPAEPSTGDDSPYSRGSPPSASDNKSSQWAVQYQSACSRQTQPSCNDENSFPAAIPYNQNPVPAISRPLESLTPELKQIIKNISTSLQRNDRRRQRSNSECLNPDANDSIASAPGAVEYYPDRKARPHPVDQPSERGNETSGRMAEFDRTFAQSYDSLYAKRFSHDPVNPAEPSTGDDSRYSHGSPPSGNDDISNPGAVQYQDPTSPKPNQSQYSPQTQWAAVPYNPDPVPPASKPKKGQLSPEMKQRLDHLASSLQKEKRNRQRSKSESCYQDPNVRAMEYSPGNRFVTIPSNTGPTTSGDAESTPGTQKYVVQYNQSSKPPKPRRYKADQESAPSSYQQQAPHHSQNLPSFGSRSPIRQQQVRPLGPHLIAVRDTPNDPNAAATFMDNSFRRQNLDNGGPRATSEMVPDNAGTPSHNMQNFPPFGSLSPIRRPVGPQHTHTHLPYDPYAAARFMRGNDPAQGEYYSGNLTDDLPQNHSHVSFHQDADLPGPQQNLEVQDSMSADLKKLLNNIPSTYRKFDRRQGRIVTSNPDLDVSIASAPGYHHNSRAQQVLQPLGSNDQPVTSNDQTHSSFDSQNRSWAQSYDSLYAKRFSHDPVVPCEDSPGHSDLSDSRGSPPSSQDENFQWAIPYNDNNGPSSSDGGYETPPPHGNCNGNCPMYCDLSNLDPEMPTESKPEVSDSVSADLGKLQSNLSSSNNKAAFLPLSAQHFSGNIYNNTEQFRGNKQQHCSFHGVPSPLLKEQHQDEPTPSKENDTAQVGETDSTTSSSESAIDDANKSTLHPEEDPPVTQETVRRRSMPEAGDSIDERKSPPKKHGGDVCVKYKPPMLLPWQNRKRNREYETIKEEEEEVELPPGCIPIEKPKSDIDLDLPPIKRSRKEQLQELHSLNFNDMSQLQLNSIADMPDLSMEWAIPYDEDHGKKRSFRRPAPERLMECKDEKLVIKKLLGLVLPEPDSDDEEKQDRFDSSLFNRSRLGKWRPDKHVRSIGAEEKKEKPERRSSFGRHNHNVTERIPLNESDEAEINLLRQLYNSAYIQQNVLPKLRCTNVDLDSDPDSRDHSNEFIAANVLLGEDGVPKPKFENTDDNCPMTNDPSLRVYWFTCRKCVRNFSDMNRPNFLPCGHIFCSLCVQGFMKNLCVGSKFLCPTCEKDIRVPEQRLTGFMDVYFIRRMHEFHEKLLTLSVSMCHNSKTHHLAQKRCVTCMRDYCDTCAEDHLACKVQHGVIDRISAIEEQVFESLLCPSYYCSEHLQVECMIVCKECRRMMCGECGTEHNKMGHNIVTLDRYALNCLKCIETLETQFFPKAFIEQDRLTTSLEERTAALRASYNHARSIICQTIKSARFFVEVLRKRLLKNCKDLERKLLRENFKLTLLDGLHKHHARDYLNRLTYFGKLANDFDLSRYIDYITNEVEYREEKAISYIRNVANVELVEFDFPQVDFPLKITKNKMKKIYKALPLPVEGITSDGNVTICVHHSTRYTSHSLVHVTGRQQTDTNQWLKEIQKLAPRVNNLSFVDICRVKYLAALDRNTVTMTSLFSGAKSGKHKIVVMCPHKEHYKIEKPRVSPTAVTGIPNAEGLFFTNASYPDIPTSLNVWTPSRGIQQFYRDHGPHTRRITEPFHMCCNRWGNVIVSETYKKSFVIFDKHGVIVAEVKTPSTPAGVCTDDNNHIYVAFPDSNQVARYDLVGGFKEFFLDAKDKLQHPICLTIVKNELLVGCVNGTVVYFDLET